MSALLLLSAARLAQVTLGPAGNTCPPSHPAKLTSVYGCRSGMHVLGYEAGDLHGSEDEADWPSGCYHCQGVSDCSDGAFHNMNAVGSANGDAQPYCALENYIQSGRVLFVGDSDIDYWPYDSMPISDSYNVGWGGYTCAEVLAEVDDLLSFFSPSAVILVCGENNLANGQSASDAFLDFEAIVSKIRESGARTIYVGTKPEPGTADLHTEYRNYDDQIKAHATSLAAAATSTPPLIVIDSYHGFEDAGNPTSLYDSDELHLSAAGYALWATWLTQAYLALASTTGESAACYVWRSGACTQPASAGAVDDEDGAAAADDGAAEGDGDTLGDSAAGGDAPCFPSSALVQLSDGTPTRVDAQGSHKHIHPLPYACLNECTS